jgi:hypothetical protein
MLYLNVEPYIGTAPYISSIVMNLAQEAEQKISSFAALPQGWDYGKGGPIPQETLDAAFEWSRYLRARGFWDTDAFPGSDGEIAVAAELGDHYLEIIVEPDGNVSIAYDRKGKQQLYLPNMSTAEARWAVSQMVGLIWSASGYYTQPSSTNVQKNSVDQLSATQKLTGIFPLSGSNVLNNPVPRSAPTSKNTTWEFPESLMIRPSSGNLNRAFSLQATP